METAEQMARDMLERAGVDYAQSMTAGDLVEIANMIDDVERLRGALITGASLLEQGCNASDMAASMRRAAAAPNG